MEIDFSRLLHFPTIILHELPQMHLKPISVKCQVLFLFFLPTQILSFTTSSTISLLSVHLTGKSFQISNFWKLWSKYCYIYIPRFGSISKCSLLNYPLKYYFIFGLINCFSSFEWRRYFEFFRILSIQGPNIAWKAFYVDFFLKWFAFQATLPCFFLERKSTRRLI